VVVVTTRIVSAVIPSSDHSAPQGKATNEQRVLPVAQLAPESSPMVTYGMAAIDRDGRLAEVAVVAALGWLPGTRLDIRVRGGLVLVTADPHAIFRVTRPGQVRLPATVRHWCRLTAGSRVLLVADPAAGRLVVHPPAALHTMITEFHAVALDGEVA
jgi:hypothetical protein